MATGLAGRDNGNAGFIGDACPPPGIEGVFGMMDGQLDVSRPAKASRRRAIAARKSMPGEVSSSNVVAGRPINAISPAAWSQTSAALINRSPR
jgi:hypothetical protein